MTSHPCGRQVYYFLVTLLKIEKFQERKTQLKNFSIRKTFYSLTIRSYLIDMYLNVYVCVKMLSVCRLLFA